jgi:hypothetical protein
MVRTLQGPPCGARVRARLKARITALAESRGLRPRPGASLSPSKPLAANRFLQRFHTEVGETVRHQLTRVLEPTKSVYLSQVFQAAFWII